MSSMFIVTFAKRTLKPSVFVLGVLCILQSGGCALWQASSSSDEVSCVTPPVLAKPKPAAPIGSVESSPTVRVPDKVSAPVIETTAIKKPVKDQMPAKTESKRVTGADARQSPPILTAPVEKTEKRPTPVAAQETTHVDKTEAAIVKPPAPHPAVPAPTVSTPAVTSPKPPAKTAVGQGGDKKIAPSLDLNSLETRLRETRAIGVFTKLALKNQVNDLLDKFRAHYQGRASTTLAQLRQPYDMLIMKVLALIQNDDPPLAKDIMNSREAIWRVLADPKKFATLSSKN